MSIFISNDLDTDIDIETHDNSHLIPTAKLYRKVIIHLYIHMVLNKFNQILVENDFTLAVNAEVDLASENKYRKSVPRLNCV